MPELTVQVPDRVASTLEMTVERVRARIDASFDMTEAVVEALIEWCDAVGTDLDGPTGATPDGNALRSIGCRLGRMGKRVTQ